MLELEKPGKLISELEGDALHNALENGKSVVHDDFEYYHKELLMDTVNAFLNDFGMHLYDYRCNLDDELFGSIDVGESFYYYEEEPEQAEYELSSMRKSLYTDYINNPAGDFKLTGEWTDMLIYTYFMDREIENTYQVPQTIVDAANYAFTEFRRSYLEKMKDDGYLKMTLVENGTRFDDEGEIVLRFDAD